MGLMNVLGRGVKAVGSGIGRITPYARGVYGATFGHVTGGVNQYDKVRVKTTESQVNFHDRYCRTVKSSIIKNANIHKGEDGTNFLQAKSIKDGKLQCYDHRLTPVKVANKAIVDADGNKLFKVTFKDGKDHSKDKYTHVIWLDQNNNIVRDQDAKKLVTSNINSVIKVHETIAINPLTKERDIVTTVIGFPFAITSRLIGFSFGIVGGVVSALGKGVQALGRVITGDSSDWLRADNDGVINMSMGKKVLNKFRAVAGAAVSGLGGIVVMTGDVVLHGGNMLAAGVSYGKLLAPGVGWSMRKEIINSHMKGAALGLANAVTEHVLNAKERLQDVKSSIVDEGGAVKAGELEGVSSKACASDKKLQDAIVFNVDGDVVVHDIDQLDERLLKAVKDAGTSLKSSMVEHVADDLTNTSVKYNNAKVPDQAPAIVSDIVKSVGIAA